MKPTLTIIFFIVSMLGVAAQHDQTGFASNTIATATQPPKKKLNFFVISKRKKGKLDLATRFNVLRTKVKAIFWGSKFSSVVAGSSAEACSKIRRKLARRNGRIGTLWFDSHGMYKKGHSLFFIGNDEFSYQTLKDSLHDDPLETIAGYTDQETNIVIGSCYGGATYQRASIDYRDTTRMNGDSLMMAMGKLFREANIYASESWVMTKPGLFRKKAAVAGFPGRKLFRDICYQPAWETVGRWNKYSARTDSLTPVNPVALNRKGSLVVRKKSYTEKEQVKKEILKNLEKLEMGLYK